MTWPVAPTTWDGLRSGSRSSTRIRGTRERPRPVPTVFSTSSPRLAWAGAVLSLEASRLAQSCSDWYRLIEICALTNTLVIDEDGIYDPTQYSDRLLLGFLAWMPTEGKLANITPRSDPCRPAPMC